MAEKTEDDILFREIDEDLRQDEFQKLWKAYGNYALAGVVVLVLSVAGFKGWQSYDISAREALGVRFQSAADLVTAGNTDEALKMFFEIAEKGGGYQMLARFNQARLLADRGEAGAVGLDDDADRAVLVESFEAAAAGEEGDHALDPVAGVRVAT